MRVSTKTVLNRKNVVDMESFEDIIYMTMINSRGTLSYVSEYLQVDDPEVIIVLQ